MGPRPKKKTTNGAHARKGIAALLDPPAERKRIDASRADVFYGWPLLGAESAAGLDPSIVRRWAQPMLSPQLGDELTPHESRALGLARYFEQCAVFVHDERVSDRVRRDAQTAIERAWKAIARIELNRGRLFVLLQAVDHASQSAQPSAALVIQSLMVARETALADALRNADKDLAALIAAWPDGSPGRRKGERKWKLAAAVWNRVAGEVVKPDSLSQLWKARRRHAKKSQTVADSLSPSFDKKQTG